MLKDPFFEVKVYTLSSDDETFPSAPSLTALTVPPTYVASLLPTPAKRKGVRKRNKRNNDTGLFIKSPFDKEM
jgi:hypothetical protein